jgi:peptidoglycan/xylan/chitin deacetylase (PgdA/CDA1 family)
MKKILTVLALLAATPAFADPYTKQGLVEPVLRLAGKHDVPTVALTFDACMGATDPRILQTLVNQRIPATIFVTHRWLRRNAEAYAQLRAHPDLFEIENHGENHIPAVDRPMDIYGIKTAGSPDGVRAEVEGGANAIAATGAPKPTWYRDATAVYSPEAISQIKAMGYRIGGFSVNGDGGSLLGVEATVRSFERARDGDVIIAHINQPTHKAGEGVVKGIEALKAKGYRFVRLMDQPTDEDKKTKTGG